MNLEGRPKIGQKLAGRILHRLSRELTKFGYHETSLKFDLLVEIINGSPEILLISQLCDPARLSVDVGAADGIYAKVIQDNSASCVTFEPNPESYATLVLRLPKARNENHALSSNPGTVSLRVPFVDQVAYRSFGTIEPANELNEFHGLQTQKVSVKADTLDSFELKNVGFIKIDVEGHEWDVLCGASNTLGRWRPNVMIEIEERHRPGNFTRIVRLFQQMGYRGFFILGFEKKPICEMDHFQYQNPERLKDGGVYVHNFFFLSSLADKEKFFQTPMSAPRWHGGQLVRTIFGN